MIVTVPPMYSKGSCALVENGLMCGKPIVTRGKCRMHWARVQRHGNPFTVKNNSGGTPLERFMRTTKRNADGCLEYTGTIRTTDGYGAFWTKETGTVLAHKWRWEHVNGPVPEGMTLDHECHNQAAARGECKGGKECPHRACVDLDHMTVKSPADNALASANHYAYRTHCANGHEFTPENTYRTKKGRACRACHVAREAERMERHKAAPKNVTVTDWAPPPDAPTHCKHGHEFTEDNTRLDVRPTGIVRVCRACQRDRYDAGRQKYNANRRISRAAKRENDGE